MAQTSRLRTAPIECGSDLICSGIWGGNRNVDRGVSAGGLEALVYATSCDGGKGGDFYYVGLCAGERFARVAIADVVGHGRAVSKVSRHLYKALRSRICGPDTARILAELNRLASREGLQAMTTAAVMAYSADERALNLSYAGHPPLLIQPAGASSWSTVGSEETDEGALPARGLPLGVAADAVYGRQTIHVAAGDRLLAYTDGVTEAPDAGGRLFGVTRLRAVLDSLSSASLAEVKSGVVRALHEHTGNGLGHDDVTLIVLEVR